MPIKDPKIYPPYWKQFSEYIRFERAGGKCEQCTAPNGKDVNRGHFESSGIPFWHDPDSGQFFNARDGFCYGRARDYELNVERESRVVLTVAHLDHADGPCRCKDETGRKCARPDHVLALCKACHLALDLPKHIENRRQSRMLERDARRTLFTEAGV